MHTGKMIDYDKESTLLLSTGTGYDSQSARSTRKFLNAELGASDFELDSPLEVTEDLDYDIDASMTTLLTNMTNIVNYNSYSYLTSCDCSSLTPEEKCLWRKLTPIMKSIILKGRNRKNIPNNRFNINKSNVYSYKTIKPPSYNGKPFTKFNLHELLN